MKFFVPLTDDAEHAELIWDTARADLFDIGMPTTRRRIRALSFHPGCERLLEVGRDTPEDDGPVMVILEASNRDVFVACPERSRRVCTPYNGVLEGAPYILALTPGSRVIDFDEEVEGWA